LSEFRTVLFLTDRIADLMTNSLLRDILERSPEFQIQPHVCLLTHRVKTCEPFDVPSDIPIHFVADRFRFDFMTGWRVSRLARHIKADTIHGWSQSGNRVASWVGGITGTPFVKSHFELLAETNSDWKPNRIGRNAKGLHLVSSSIIREQLLERIEPGQAEFHQADSRAAADDEPIANELDNSIRTLAIHADQVFRDDAGVNVRESLGLPKDGFLIVACADFLPRNRLKDLLWAVDLVQCVRHDFRFVLFGNGPQAWRLRRFAEQCTADQKTVFVDGLSRFRDVLLEADVYWHSFIHEPVPYNIKLAMKSRCAIVAPRCHGIADIVQDGVNGHLVDVGKRDQFARVTNALFKHPETLERFKLAAGESDADRNLETTIQSLLDAYRHLDE